MPFAIPSLRNLSRQIHGFIRARMPGGDGEIWPNNLRIIGKVIAMAAHEGDLRAEYIYSQIFASTAEGPYLRLHAYEVGIAPKLAAAAIGHLVFAATPGVTFTAGLRFVRADGAFFVSSAAATAVGNSVTIPVAAEEPGAAGNTPPGATFRLAAPVPELADEGEAAPQGIGGGAEGENDAQLRARVLFRKRNRPRGGHETDYAIWCTEVPGITRAFVKGWAPGAGAVSVYPLKAGSGADAIPSVADLAPVAAHVERRRPATAAVYLQQATGRFIDVTIQGIAPDTLAVRAEVDAEIRDLFDERAVVALPGEVTVFSRSWIAESVSAALGESRHVLQAPAADVVLNPGEYPVLGVITFV